MAKNLNIKFGKRINNEAYDMVLNKAPHMLVGGCTGSGKSVFINTIITQIIGNNKPDEVEIYLGDPKRVEFALYERAPHVKFVAKTLEEHDYMIWMLMEKMEERYRAMEKEGITDVVGDSRFSNIVVFIDEYGNLVLNKRHKGVVAKRISERIICLAQMGRAAGIIMVIATQYPNAKLVDMNIKTQFPTRVCLKVATHTESNVILGRGNSEGANLRGKGHMLVQNPSTEIGILELQGFYFSKEGINNVIDRAIEKEQKKVVNDISIRKPFLYLVK